MSFLAGHLSPQTADTAPALAARRVRMQLAPRGAAEAAWAFEPSARGRVLLLSPATRRGARLLLGFDGQLSDRSDLEQRLRAEGHAPRGADDADLVLAAWEAWGDAALPLLDGAFALAVHDARRGTLTLARDRFGRRPLLYALPAAGGLAFATGLGALMAWPGLAAAADADVLGHVLGFGHAPVGRSPMAGVRRLGPGAMLTLSAAGAPPMEVPWCPAPAERPARLPAAAVTERIVAQLRAALRDGPAALPAAADGAALLAACLPAGATLALPPPAPDAGLLERAVAVQGEPPAMDALLPALAAPAGGLLLAPAGGVELLLAHRRYRIFARDAARLRDRAGPPMRRRDGGLHESPLTARDLWHEASGGMAEAERLLLCGPALIHTLTRAMPDAYGLSLEEAGPQDCMARAARLDLALRLPARDLPALDTAAVLAGARVALPFLEGGLPALLSGLPDAARRWLLPVAGGAEADLSAWHPLGPALREMTTDLLLGGRCGARDLFSRGRLEAALNPRRPSAGLGATTLWTLLGIELWCRAFLDAPAALPAPAPDLGLEAILAPVREAA